MNGLYIEIKYNNKYCTAILLVKPNKKYNWNYLQK